MKPFFIIVFSLMALTACTESQPEASDPFTAAVKNKQRPDNDVDQDRYRKPAELLHFWKLSLA